MKKVHQTEFGEEAGNCLQAALASIFEIDIDTIPYFQDAEDWYDEFAKWMVKKFGLEPVDFALLDNIPPSSPHGYCIFNGLSPRGDFQHCVVGRGGFIVHDPHPDGTGLRNVESITVFIKVLE